MPLGPITLGIPAGSLLLSAKGPVESADQYPAHWVTTYGCLIDNVRTALDWAFAPGGDATIGVALTIAAVPLWLNMSLMDECCRRVKSALENCGAGADQDAHHRMQLFTALGVALYSIGPGPETKAAWSEVLEIAESLDDTDHLLRALWGLWVVCVTGGKHRPGLSLAGSQGLQRELLIPLPCLLAKD